VKSFEQPFQPRHPFSEIGYILGYILFEHSEFLV
jgi:hypothetical protein